MLELNREFGNFDERIFEGRVFGSRAGTSLIRRRGRLRRAARAIQRHSFKFKFVAKRPEYREEGAAATRDGHRSRAENSLGGNANTVRPPPPSLVSLVRLIPGTELFLG